MRFAAPFLNALLIASTAGYPNQVALSEKNCGVSTLEYSTDALRFNPSPKAKEAFRLFCNRPYVKGPSTPPGKPPKSPPRSPPKSPSKNPPRSPPKSPPKKRPGKGGKAFAALEEALEQVFEDAIEGALVNVFDDVSVSVSENIHYDAAEHFFEDSYGEDSCSRLGIQAKPAGYTTVSVDQYLPGTATSAGLWTGQLGTCMGIAITGTAGQPGGTTRFLYHMSMQKEPAQVTVAWNIFAQAVRNSGLTRMNAILYTVETRPNSPALRDPDITAYAAAVEDVYKDIATALSQLIGGTAGRRYHSWQGTSELSIAPNNAINPH